MCVIEYNKFLCGSRTERGIIPCEWARAKQMNCSDFGRTQKDNYIVLTCLNPKCKDCWLKIDKQDKKKGSTKQRF